jgi:Zn-dependent protease
MLLRVMYATGQAIAAFLVAGVYYFAIALFVTTATSGRSVLESVAAATICLIVAIIIHEFGHFAGARMLKVGVRAIYLGGPPATVRLRIGKTPVYLGIRLKGMVWHDPAGTPARAALITAAGPAANLLAAFLALAVSEVLAKPAERTLTLGFAVIFAGFGVANLLPFRSRAGRLSDGGRILQLLTSRPLHDLTRLLGPDWMSRPDATDQLYAAYEAGVREAQEHWEVLMFLLRRDGRTAELLQVHGRLRLLPDVASTVGSAERVARRFAEIEWAILTLPDLPLPAADLAATRLEWVTEHISDKERPAALHSLAAARLRQGRYSEVEALCAPLLAGDLAGENRATVLATIAMARRGLGQPWQEHLAEAVRLAPQADLVPEAAGHQPAPTTSN